MKKKLEKPFFKRIFAAGLALFMLLSLMPKSVPVHAEEALTNLALTATFSSNVTVLADANNINNGNKDTGVWRNSTADVYSEKDYYEFTWSDAVSVNQVALSAKDKSSAPVSWHVEVSADGTAWSNVAGIADVTWATDNSTAETKTMTFAPQENIKALRVYIDAAIFNAWGYGFTEIEVYHNPTAVADSARITSENLGESAIISASDNIVDEAKKKLPMIKDGSSLTPFFREGLTNTVSGQTASVEDYYQFNWENPVSVNQVDMAVVNAGCQAPTAWHVEVSADGTTGWTKVASVSDMKWEGEFEEIQTKKLGFALQKNIKGLRVYIDKAYLEWYGYGIVDLEVYKVENSEGNKTEPVAPPNGNYAQIATVSTEVALSDWEKQTLSRINDGNCEFASLFFRIASPSEIEGKDYYQFNWESPVSVNQVKMVVMRALNQAPTAWHVDVSKDGTTGWTKVASISDVKWKKGDDTVETKNLNFALQENIKGLRVYIDKAHYTWNGYGINEIEIKNGSGDNKTEPVVPPNGNYAQIATVSTEIRLSDWEKETFGRLNDGKNDNIFFRIGDAAEIEGKDYYQFNWESPVSVNQVRMAVTRAGSQAPTAWHVEVSADGTTGWTKVASIADVKWEGEFEEVHTKNLGFALQENIKGLRVYIDKANLEWDGYGINEIGIYKASSPMTGDNMPVAPIMLALVISATGVAISVSGYRKNRKYI